MRVLLKAVHACVIEGSPCVIEGSVLLKAVHACVIEGSPCVCY